MSRSRKGSLYSFGAGRLIWRWPIMLVLAGSMFVLGFYTHRSRPFPYPQVRHLVKSFSRNGRVEALRSQYYDDIQAVSLDRNIDTALLPLKVSGIRLSNHLPIPKVAGGITAINGHVIVLDRLGNIYSWLPGGAEPGRPPVPPLPNNVEDYVRRGGHVDESTFRAYDIEYLAFARTLAVSHEYFDPNLGKTRLAVSTIAIEEETLRPLGEWKIVFLSDPEPGRSNEESGGRLAARAPDKLYVTLGDYMVTSPNNPQDMNSTFGKIFEVDLRGGSRKIVSLGHRNPQGLVIAKNGAMYATEHGPKGGDELNLIIEGTNYGWPDVSLGTGYASYDFLPHATVGRHNGYVPPVFAWMPSIGPSNLIEVQGFDWRWNGDLLVASLKANSLFRLRMEGARVLYAEPIWIGQRIRDMMQMPDGTIVLWTDDSQLLLLSVDREQLAQNLRAPSRLSEVLNDGCMYCHHFGPTSASDIAPSLTNLFSRKIASDNFPYSEGLRSKSGVWTDTSLKQFLANPSKFANGTNMPPINYSPEAIDEIIEVLKEVQHAQAAPRAH